MVSSAVTQAEQDPSELLPPWVNMDPKDYKFRMSDLMFRRAMERHHKGIQHRPTFLPTKLRYSPGDCVCEVIAGRSYCFTIKYRYWDGYDWQYIRILDTSEKVI